MKSQSPSRIVRSWNPSSRKGEGAAGPDLLRRREIWFVAVLVLLVLLLLIWQQNRTWNLTHDLAALEEEQLAMQSRVRVVGTQVAEKRQPDFIMAGLLPNENPSLDLADRYMVAAGSRRGSTGPVVRYEAWLASLGITVPSALAASTR